MSTTDHLPDDETGNALSRYIRDGSDLTRLMSMDFFAVVPSQVAGEAVRTSSPTVLTVSGSTSGQRGTTAGYSGSSTRLSVAVPAIST